MVLEKIHGRAFKPSKAKVHSSTIPWFSKLFNGLLHLNTLELSKTLFLT